MTTEKKIGRPTAWHAGNTIARRSPRAGCSPKCSRSRCIAFSDITIDASTRMPIEIAIPARDMMFVWISASPRIRSRAISANEPSTASGNVNAMMNDVRTWRRIKNTQADAVRIASKTVQVTVRMAPSIRGVRS